MIEVCKYRLPCGRCDKFDTHCDLTYESIDFIVKEKCEHEWRYDGQITNGHNYKCIKCGTIKTVPLENLSSTDTRGCEHHWILEEQQIIRQKVSYKTYKCSICGKERMIKTEVQDGNCYETLWERA